jgi:CelD/BcsL family acetyltransferase involved in cellulose biosynthesis
MSLHQTRESDNRKPAFPFTIELVSSEEALSALEVDWNRLSESAEDPNAFVTYGWFRAWASFRIREFPNGRLLPYVLVVKDGTAVIGIAPLVRRISSRLGIRMRRLEFVTNHSDYNQLVLGDDSVNLTQAIVDFLARTATEWDMVDLRELPDAGGRVAQITDTLVRAGLPFSILPEPDACPYMTIGGDTAILTARLSGHVRRTLRNRSARAAAKGLRTRIIEDPAQERGLLKKLIDLEYQKHLRSIYLPLVGTFPEVFQSVFDNLGPRGWLYVALLEQGDQPIAYQLGFRCGSKFWDYAKAYDRSFSCFAPGTLLLLSLLDYCFERGFREYDFLRGEESYKTLWSSGIHRRYRVLFWNQRGISRARKFIYHNIGSVVYGLLRKRI